jgi:nicotinate-nucleotide pyrophosphorylase (carboxylating)
MKMPDEAYINRIVGNALSEDIGCLDITTHLTGCSGLAGYGEFVAKDDGVMAGFFVAAAVFKALSCDFIVRQNFEEGQPFKKGDILGSIEGDFGLMLSGERTALNFLQRTSAIASETRKACDMVSHTGVKLLDTRKTVPGLRLLDKYAVKAGGGENHRTGLFDMILIKNNHISANLGIDKAIENALLKKSPDMMIEDE